MFIINLLCILIGIALYVKGETSESFLGKSNKNWKLAVGVPFALVLLFTGHWIQALICILAYVIASWAFGYGVNNLWTKWFGEDAAVIITGAALGLALSSYKRWMGIPQAVLAGWGWGLIYQCDKAGKIKEPYVALYRITIALILALL
jgi:hypothetical protein